MGPLWFVQFRAFIWKIFLQRLRAPVTTGAELLLPCLFTLLLAVGYWFSVTTNVPATDYSVMTPTNMSSLMPAFFCQNMSHPRRFGRSLAVPPCPPQGERTLCLPSVREGALCVRDSPSAARAVFGASAASGSVVVPTLDAYLALSAFATYQSRKTNPTFFDRSGWASLSHFGRLLIVAAEGEGGTSLGTQFAQFCANVSVLCGEVAYTDRIFASMAAAQAFAREHDNEVWAIVELSAPLSPRSEATVGAGNTRGGNVFTISMNYTATPWTFESYKRVFRGLGKKENMLYVSSGFLTLQNLVQQFYVRHRLDGMTSLPSSGANASGLLEYVNLHGPLLVSMPSPPHVKNSFYSHWAYFMPLLAMFAALFPVAKLVTWIVEEKSLRIRESMQIMGLRWSCMAFGWFFSAFLMDCMASLLAAVVLKISFFYFVDFGVLFCLYFTFMQQNTAFGLFLSTWFTNPRTAGAVTALCIFLCSMPYYSFPDGMSMTRLVAMSFMPCVAYAKSFEALVRYASFGHGFSWKQTLDGDFSVALAIGLMWASSGVFLIFWMYLDQVLPSSIGRRRHPLFFLSCLRRLGCCCCGRRGAEPKKPRVPPREPGSSDDDKKSLFAAEFYNLKKVYETGGFLAWLHYFVTGQRRDGDRCEALRDVSFELEFGKVNVLLGSNGSGKSTIMGIATGMVKPTSGEVYICGHDATNQLGSCYKHIGYCPQSDIVWESLTVEEHLAFYARMKASGRWDVKEQVDCMIDRMQLEEKRYTTAECLSGGQRRRLCVGIALIGNPDVLFLDEPAAGMDIKGRKAVYDALQKDRNQRAVLISTHLLEEADRVGDRILLMHDGVLRGAGQPLFLKSKMDVGYVVTCVVDTCSSEMEENMRISQLTEFVRTKSYPGHSCTNSREAQIIPPRCKLLGVERRGREISFRFPFSLLSSAGSSIIRELEEQRQALGLRSIGLSLTTLQDVMDSVTPRQRSQPESKRSGERYNDDDTTNGISIQMTGVGTEAPFQGIAVADGDAEDVRGNVHEEATSSVDPKQYYDQHAQSFNQHFGVLFMKRVNSAKRDVCLLVFQIILPVMFLAIALLADLMDPPSQPPLVLDASLYPGHKVHPYSEVTWTTSSSLPDVFGVGNSDVSSAFGPYYTPVKVPCTMESCSSSLSRAMIPDLTNHSATRLIALSLTSLEGEKRAPTSVLMHNVSVHHSAPQALNALYNVVNHQLFGQDTMMTARNQPMKMGPFEQKMASAFRRVIFGIFVLLPFTFIPSNTIAQIVRESQSGSRHLQWLAGANVCAFWLSSIVFDFCCYLVTEALAMLVFFLFKRTEFIGNSQAVGATLALFAMFGLSSVLFSYVLSFFFRSPFVAQSVVLVANFILGFLWVMGEQIIGGIADLQNFMLYTTYILRIIPSVSFGEGVFVLSGVELVNLMFPGRPQPNLFGLLHFENGKFKGGIGTGLIYMFFTSVGSLLVLVMLEYARVQRTMRLFTRSSCCGGQGKATSDSAARRCPFSSSSSLGLLKVGDDGDAGEEVDESVAREEAEVCARTSGRPEDCIALQHVTKRYPGTKRAAVDDLSLGVHKGEIMALLGLNGAGKTTTVSILAGEVVSTLGSAYINHISILNPASRRYIGYCPQRDALIDHLSPYEHLRLYAGLRGARDAYVRNEIPRLLDALGLTAVQNAPAFSLSGGNKRRLSLAIALVGGTTSVLLDEPTAGMDFTARRQTCAVIKRLTRQKSVVFTTHMLDETAALADRVAFISKGKLQCVGTPQELKTRFTDDAVYNVHVVFARTAGNAIGADSDIAHRLCECFRADDGQKENCCVVESVADRTVTLLVRRSLFHICSVATGLREGTIAGLPPVSHVSATQPTLEDILLRM